MARKTHLLNLGSSTNFEIAFASSTTAYELRPSMSTQSALRAQVFPFASDKKCPRFESKWPGHRGSAYSQLKDAPLAARLAGAKG